MRTASIRAGLLGLAVAALGLPATASAAPQVTLKARAVPIPVNPASAKSKTYPHTGNILGAGAALEAQFKISGTEYGGFPSPLTKVVFDLPAGTKLNTGPFKKCSQSVLESHEVQKCPKTSIASPKGSVSGVVAFGESRVHETLSLQAFFTSRGLTFFAEGKSPVSIEVLSEGTVSKGHAPSLTTEVPLVATVPNAPYASVESIKVKVGAAIKKHKKLVSYGTMPRKCPKGGFRVKAVLSFLSGETATATAKAPCPRK